MSSAEEIKSEEVLEHKEEKEVGPEDVEATVEDKGSKTVQGEEERAEQDSKDKDMKALFEGSGDEADADGDGDSYVPESEEEEDEDEDDEVDDEEDDEKQEDGEEEEEEEEAEEDEADEEEEVEGKMAKHNGDDEEMGEEARSEEDKMEEEEEKGDRTKVRKTSSGARVLTPHVSEEKDPPPPKKSKVDAAEPDARPGEAESAVVSSVATPLRRSGRLAVRAAAGTGTKAPNRATTPLVRVPVTRKQKQEALALQERPRGPGVAVEHNAPLKSLAFVEPALGVQEKVEKKKENDTNKTRVLAEAASSRQEKDTEKVGQGIDTHKTKALAGAAGSRQEKEKENVERGFSKHKTKALAEAASSRREKENEQVEQGRRKEQDMQNGKRDLGQVKVVQQHGKSVQRGSDGSASVGDLRRAGAEINEGRKKLETEKQMAVRNKDYTRAAEVQKQLKDMDEEEEKLKKEEERQVMCQGKNGSKNEVCGVSLGLCVVIVHVVFVVLFFWCVVLSWR